MLEKRWATPEDKNDIIDFIDFVFSKAHRPHDFATLLPKLYGKDADTTAHHFLIKEDGKLLAAILAYPVEMTIAGERFMSIGVGSVSTHPRARGRGFMDDLLAAVDAHAGEVGADFAVLGGLRQRYGYYGYDLAGCHLTSSLLVHNAQHAWRDVNASDLSLISMTESHVNEALALHAAQPSFCARPRDAFLAILRSWENQPMAILRGAEIIGYAVLSPSGTSVLELTLARESDAPAVLRFLSDTYGDLSLITPPWNTQRVQLLTRVCQSFSIAPSNMVKFYRTDRLRQALSRLGTGDKLRFDGLTPPLPLYIERADRV